MHDMCCVKWTVTDGHATTASFYLQFTMSALASLANDLNIQCRDDSRSGGDDAAIDDILLRLYKFLVGLFQAAYFSRPDLLKHTRKYHKISIQKRH